jgi:undecaprenyl diphosphate synthase
MWKKLFKKDIEQQKDIAEYELDTARIPKHIAIIMDGNGRWAQKRGLPRTFGHREGAETLHRIVKTSSDLGVKVLTAYAFSTENWKRPKEEVSFLMSLISEYIDIKLSEMHKNNVQIHFIGKIDELAGQLQQKMHDAEKLTATNTGLVLNLAINYGSRAEIVRAVRIIAEKVAAGKLALEDITEATISQHLYTSELCDPDLIIRPGSDLRISNYLLWQSAYSEFWFTDINWPDFKDEHLIRAILDYQNRERRFGGLKKK